MILELFTLIAFGIGATILLAALVDWAHEVFLSFYDGIVGFLYAIRRPYAGASLEVFTQTSNRGWLKNTREVSESELPNELKNLTPNVKTQISRFAH